MCGHFQRNGRVEFCSTVYTIRKMREPSVAQGL
jgi:hypothetical protein